MHTDKHSVNDEAKRETVSSLHSHPNLNKGCVTGHISQAQSNSSKLLQSHLKWTATTN